MFVFSGLDKTSKTPANQGRVVEPTKPTQLPDIDEHAEREPSRMATLPSRSSHASESLETAFIFHSTQSSSVGHCAAQFEVLYANRLKRHARQRRSSLPGRVRLGRRRKLATFVAVGPLNPCVLRNNEHLPCQAKSI